MIEVNIPGRGTNRLQHLALDLNGTLALDGVLLDGVEERLHRLGGLLETCIITADTHGTASRLAERLKVTIHRLGGGDENAQKLAVVRKLGPEETVAIGNGANDVAMLKEAAIGICVLGPEGAAAEAMATADVVVGHIHVALDMLLNPKRFAATLRR